MCECEELIAVGRVVGLFDFIQLRVFSQILLEFIARGRMQLTGRGAASDGEKQAASQEKQRFQFHDKQV